MIKYKTIAGKPFMSPMGNFKTQCTGCVRDKSNIITCICFIKLQVSKGLKNCNNGYIYLEDNDG